jgi:hypothetical protein
VDNLEHRIDEATGRPRRPEKQADRGPTAWISTVGNAAAARLFRRTAGGGGVVDERVAGEIQERRGGGGELDHRVRDELGPTLGHDFSDVRVHTDARADALNRAVHAEAFTTGRDIFFRSGKYDPTSNEGRRLLAHELTHVVQQRDAPPATELTVSDPGDASERQASAVAERVAAPSVAPAPAQTVARAEDEQPEEVQTSALAREEEEKPEEQPEEQAAASPIQREDDEIDEAT